MAVCPNKSLESWKMLVASRGEALAYYLWDKYNGEVPESESKSEIVKASLKAVDILSSTKAEEVFNKGQKNNWALDKILTELQVPKEQKEIIINNNYTRTEVVEVGTAFKDIKNLNKEAVEEMERMGYTTNEILDKFNEGKSSMLYQEKSYIPTPQEIVTDLLSKYNYTVEINTTKDNIDLSKGRLKVLGGYIKLNNGWYIEGGGRVSDELQIELENKYNELNFKQENTKYYINLTVPGGTNYTENEVSTPSVIPSIKGHVNFSTDSGIGWFRTDDKQNYTEQDIDILIDNMIKSGVLQKNCS